MRRMIAFQGADGEVTLWRPSTLRQLGLQEAHLEAALCANPELLCLESRSTGVYGPFVVFNRLLLPTPQGRTIEPDIVLLAASGDVIMVEVKRFGNRELEDRRVIAQAIDYVSSISALDLEGLARLFGGGDGADWISLVMQHFPRAEDVEDLAKTLEHNAADGNVHIVVACDKVPHGVREQARSVSAQSHLGFSLDIIEVAPYVQEDSAEEGIMFVPHVELSTEIISRTAVTVRLEGAGSHTVTVESPSARGGGTNPPDAAKRYWTDQEVEDAVLASDDPAVHELFRFAREEGVPGRIQSSSRRASPAFGYYVAIRKASGGIGAYQLFTWVQTRSKLSVYMSWENAEVPPGVSKRYKDDLRAVFGAVIDRPEPNIPLTEVGDKLEEFKAAIRRFQVAVGPTQEAQSPAASLG